LQDGCINLGRVVPVAHVTQRLPCQLCDAHVAVAVDL
jgi:hypothetical protein